MAHKKHIRNCLAVILGLVTFVGPATGALADSPGSSEVVEKAATGSQSVLLAQADVIGEDQEEMLELLSVLDAETEIATKTKMNSDYVPGIVTVLHGDHLESLGVKTVLEALSMVPGIQISRIATGEPSVKVRGFAYPFNAGNIKVMLNSIALSRESSGINSSVLLTPVVQVERIEVVRGPGSSIYGDFAMAGVVNIITKNEGGRLFVAGGDDESLGGGGHYAYRDEEKEWGADLNISMMNDADSAGTIDRNPDEERFAGVLHVDYKKFSFTAEGVSRGIDFDRVGPRQIQGAPPPFPPPSRIASRSEDSWVFEGRQTFDLSPDAALEAHLSYLQNDFKADEPESKFDGDRVEGGLDLNWTPSSSHQLLFGVMYTDSAIDEAYDRGAPGDLPQEAYDKKRRSFSLAAQDQVTVNDRFSVTLGLRYDDYDDVGDLLTPRLAGVYRIGENHVLKAQYSEGFRAPTFWELYQSENVNKSLDFEVIDTTELAYIYRRPKAVGRVTLYYSKIDNGIYKRLGKGFDNYVNIESKGVEVEWEQQIGDNFRWLANISYIDTSDERWFQQNNDNNSPGVSDWLGNLAIFFQPMPRVTITGRLTHVGDQHALSGWIDGYDSVDLTFSRMDLFAPGIILRAGVRNIFDEPILYTIQRPNGLYTDEFRGRTFWLQVSYDF